METPHTQQFAMVAKTFQGLEDVLAEELRNLGALNVEPGNRMVSFEGDKKMLYMANMWCRTAVRILKPIASFTAVDTDDLYDRLKQIPWGDFITTKQTFSIDSVVYSDVFTNSRYVTYRFKDAIVDWFQDRMGDMVRPRVRLEGADMMFNIHIAGSQVTVSLDSSGESLHKRGWRVESTDAPINEILAAGIILKSGWRGDSDFVDPMCGSGTFLIEAAMIGANIMPGIYRKHFAFETWADFDRELFEAIYNDESTDRDFTGRIIGSDISRAAIAVAEANIKSAGLSKLIKLECKPLSDWEEAPSDNGVIVTNPPYGRRLKVEDLEGLYDLLGKKLKFVFPGWHAWVIGFNDDNFAKIGLAASRKERLFNGALDCELREYIMFSGDYRAFRESGGSLGREADEKPVEEKPSRKAARPLRDKAAKGNARYQRPDRDKREGRNRDGKPRFGKDDRKSRFDRKFDKKDRKPRFDRDEKPFEDNRSEAEQLLNRKRNTFALKGIVGKRPSLSDDKPTMRQRRGWRKPDNDNPTNTSDEQ